ncbi:hypothetical protein CB0940_08447 [Cercospora beticola]|uniref:Uncharacterized protein n=1 Tax=Cercospora beticola TaxID=122368 RepID=A0A2G5HRM9_CERBT|nr:hypothetical protein CB0940_08447 [Cercospora beticola]PIA94953.1 hypothetical protein CB0940_08447 [Cercospora beticola]
MRAVPNAAPSMTAVCTELGEKARLQMADNCSEGMATQITGALQQAGNRQVSGEQARCHWFCRGEDREEAAHEGEI